MSNCKKNRNTNDRKPIITPSWCPLERENLKIEPRLGKTVSLFVFPRRALSLSWSSTTTVSTRSWTSPRSAAWPSDRSSSTCTTWWWRWRSTSPTFSASPSDGNPRPHVEEPSSCLGFVRLLASLLNCFFNALVKHSIYSFWSNPCFLRCCCVSL